jgi:enoyl-CoA hydratase/carnithine racemase
MAWVAKSKLSPATFHRLIFEPKRYGGSEACQAGLVDMVASESQLMEIAHQFAQKGASKVARAGRIVQQLKQVCYMEVTEKLDLRVEIDVRAFMRPKM